MDANQYVLWEPHESRTIQEIHAIIPSSSRKKGAKECKGSASRGKTSLQVLCKTREKLHISIMEYGSTNISLYQMTSNKIRPKIDQTNRSDKYDDSKWLEKPNFRNS